MSVAYVYYETSPPSSPYALRIVGAVCLRSCFSDVYRNAIGSFHDARLARNHAVGWNVTSRLGTSYLSQGPNLYQRERHAHLVGKVVIPDCTGDFTYANLRHLPLSDLVTEQTKEEGS